MPSQPTAYEGSTFDVPDVFQFGYGSLINGNFRKELNTWSNEQVIPVRVKSAWGYRRAWNFQHPEAKLTALGLEKCAPGDGWTINGVIYPVTAASLRKLEQREKGYKLLKIPMEYLEPVSWQALPSHIGDVVVYEVEDDNAGEPSPIRPLVQSYIDVCINGCLSYNNQEGVGQVVDRKTLMRFIGSLPIDENEKARLADLAPESFEAAVGDGTDDDGTNFAMEFIETTHGWSQHWVNDRAMARRPWLAEPAWAEIDSLLSTHPATREFFANRRID